VSVPSTPIYPAEKLYVRLEIYFTDSRSLLIVFLIEQKRIEIDQRLSEIIGQHSSELPLTPGLPRTPKVARIRSKVMSGFRADDLSAAQRRWQAREISNVGLEYMFPRVWY
jgi:hypothetical protein